MSRQAINVGVVAGDGTGDSGQVPFTKTNNNFIELYSAAWYGADSGAVNAYVVALASLFPQPTSLALVAGQLLRLTVANTNTGAATINVAGSGALNILGETGQVLLGGELVSTGPALLQYTGAAWQVVATTGAQQGYQRTAAETAAGVMPVQWFYLPGIVDRYGVNTTPFAFTGGGLTSNIATATDMSTALNNCLSSNLTATFLGTGYALKQAGGFNLFGKRMAGAGAHATILALPNVSGAPAFNFGGIDVNSPGATGMQITGLQNTTALGAWLLKEAAIGCRRGLFIDVYITGFVRSDAIVFTGALLANATSATLNAAWTLPTGYYSIMFSDGEQKQSFLQNGSTAVSWLIGLTNGVTANALCLTGQGIDLTGSLGAGVYYNTFINVAAGGQNLQPVVLTGAPIAGATSATLNANWTGASGVYAVQFSDSEMRLGTLTNGATTLTWSIGLVNGVTTAVNVTSGNAAGWRYQSSDGAVNGNRANQNNSLGCTSTFNAGDAYSLNYAAENSFFGPDREANGGVAFNLGVNCYGTTVIGGDSEGVNFLGAVLKNSPSSDFHLFGGNIIDVPSPLNWTIADHWLPGGSGATNFGVAPNSFAGSNLVIGGGVINMTATNPAWRLTGSTVFAFNTATKGVIAEGPFGMAAAGPASQVTGFGTPTGTGVINNFPGATATLAQCSQAIAEIINDLKSLGLYGA